MQFFLPSQKMMIPKHNIKKDNSFFFNKCWLDCQRNNLYIFFNKNQVNQLYLSNNKASCHHIYVIDTHRAKKLCLLNPTQEFIEMEAWLRQTFFTS